MFKHYKVHLPNISLLGNKQTGKSTQAKFLLEEFGYRVFHHADNVRLLACKLLAKYSKLTSTEIFDLAFTGEDYEYYKTNPLQLDGIILSNGTRPLLEGVGDECRNLFGDTTWINALMIDIGKYDKHFVIADTRYENEIINSHLRKYIIIHLTKPDSDGNVPSEKVESIVQKTSVKPDYTIPYNLGIEKVKNRIEQIVFKHLRIDFYVNDKPLLEALHRYGIPDSRCKSRDLEYVLSTMETSEEASKQESLFQETVKILKILKEKNAYANCEYDI